MYRLKRLPEFDAWFNALRDGVTKQRLLARLRKAQLGNLGDVKSVGSGVFEMREHFGAGWRMYYTQIGGVFVIMLGGGDKSSQSRDIAKAIDLAQHLEA